MGCDIHSHAERKINGKWKALRFSPFNYRNYGMFGFLANVRNYSEVPCISKPRGLPNDVSKGVAFDYQTWDSDAHSASWLNIAELAAFNYDAIMENRRCTIQTSPNCWNGGATCKLGEGIHQTFREFLGPEFFKDLQKLIEIEAERIVFWFDN